MSIFDHYMPRQISRPRARTGGTGTPSATEAGFPDIREVFAAPTDPFRHCRFRA